MPQRAGSSNSACCDGVPFVIGERATHSLRVPDYRDRAIAGESELEVVGGEYTARMMRLELLGRGTQGRIGSITTDTDLGPGVVEDPDGHEDRRRTDVDHVTAEEEPG
jgi:hypothetical protein